MKMNKLINQATVKMSAMQNLVIILVPRWTRLH